MSGVIGTKKMDRKKKEKQIAKRKKAEKSFSCIAMLLALVFMMSAVGGCKNAGTGGEGSSALGNGAGGGQNEGISSDAMGRYVEESLDLSGKLSGSGNKIYRLSNGNLMICDRYRDFVKADGDGAVWMTDIRRWRTRMIEDGTYIMSMAVGADNTVALIYQGEEDTAVGEGSGSDDDAEEIVLNPKLLVVKPDNTEIPVEIAITEEDAYLDQVYIAENGRIFVSVRGTANLYEVKEDGSSELFLMVEEGHPDLIQFQGNIMAIDGYGYDGLLLYDMEKGIYIEDDVLTDFVKENYEDRGRGSLDSYNLYFFFGEDDIIYLAGEKGLYRHVIGGSVMEQIIDGKLCSLGNPAYELQGMVILDNSEFLALFQEGQLVHYIFDPDIPTVPNEKLTVYGLYDNEIIRQAITLFQTYNPEVYVEYIYGVSGDDSVTKEDALKSLNTKIMAGEGPDVLVLDNMPVNSYIEKGLLLDLGPIVNGLHGEAALFENIVGAVKTGEEVYMIPCEVRLPVMMGDKKYFSAVGSLTDIADTAETLREDYPEQDLLGISSEKGIMRLFAMTCAPAWITPDAEINREVLKEFMEQTGRIYEAQTKGVPDRVLERYRQMGQDYEMYNGVASFEDSDYLRMANIVKMNYIGGYTQSLFGIFDCMDMCSIQKIDGFESVVWMPMAGQCEHVFWAKTLLGINAASEKQELAQDFLKICLGKENQSYLYNSLPVNIAAFDDSLALPENRTGSDGMYGSVVTDGEEGEIIKLIYYWPTGEETAAYRKYMEEADTAYIQNDIIETAVYEEGAAYMQGTKSLDEAVEAVEKKISIYMAE